MNIMLKCIYLKGLLGASGSFGSFIFLCFFTIFCPSPAAPGFSDSKSKAGKLFSKVLILISVKPRKTLKF